ncbi:unannotated protein [freshwater metagenome]|uniref:Unannotated protein n=1 Tax=freshwater metagenome TaxID=449393 RepID=A0A6J6NIC0_9ZZZZ|nr:biotin--[acetyl-CoA-carboxylase] ligase [Actinomycetota bacterium]
METLRASLDSERIYSALKNSYWRVSVVDVTGSTHTDLVAQIRNGNSKHGDVLVSEFQSAGRGRLERSFIAPARSALLFSFHIKPHRPVDTWGWLPLLAGQALITTISKLCTLSTTATLKWPNDILINEKKVAGLLSEKVSDEAVVIGIGINVGMTKEELPTPLATSLSIEGCSQCDRSDFLSLYLKTFSEYLKRWEAGEASLINEYAELSSTIGRAISITAPDGKTRQAHATGIDQSGALIIDGAELITVGDVAHLRSN